MKMTTYDRVVSVLAETAGVPASRLAPEVRLDDLGLDSLALLEVGLAIQTECAVEVDDAAVAQSETVADLVELVLSGT